MGVAQLSNRLLLPPDGLTFASLSKGELLGNAWMALPLVPTRQNAKVPIGKQSWTLFLRSANFEGAVAFYVPDIWSRMSESYPIIQRRGLDMRPGEMGSGAMEVNTVPYLEADDDGGNVYSKIPRLQFPVADNGITVLMQDITLYSGVALFQPLYRHLFRAGGQVNGFDPRGAWKPNCTANPIRFRQGNQDIPLVGFDSRVKTITFGAGVKNSFGLQWTQARGTGALPEYFRQAGNRRVAIQESEVPEDLRSTGFRPARATQSYTSPSAKDTVWSSPGPASAILKAKLTDGSTLTYAWYRFIDQPSIVAQNWPQAHRDQVQQLIEKLHVQWSDAALTVPPPTSGTLCALDRAQLVTPPTGMEKGYVPIVLRQARE